MKMALVMAGAVLVVAASGFGAGAVPAGHPAKNHCPSSTRFLQALSATYHHHRVTITGHQAHFVCLPVEFIKASKATTTFKLVRSTLIHVFDKPYEDPSKTHRIRDRAFPAYLAHQQVENYYIWTGSRLAITSLKPGFQS
jgi:hypothetical protein